MWFGLDLSIYCRRDPRWSLFISTKSRLISTFFLIGLKIIILCYVRGKKNQNYTVNIIADLIT